MEVKNYELSPNPRELTMLDPNEEIYLVIVIGNGQIGASKATINGQVVARGDLSHPTFIGLAGNLINVTLNIETRILDVNPFTNKCVFTTSLITDENRVLYNKIDNGDAPSNGIANFIGNYLFRAVAIVLFFSLLASNSFAQNVELKDLETPSSPGFILLDETPSSIEKPTTPQGLGLSLLNFVETGAAVEFAPYWLTNHPTLTARHMTRERFPVLSHFAVSVAGVKSDSTSYLAGGVRTRLYKSYGSKIQVKLDSVHNEIQNLLAADDLDLDEIERMRKEYVEIMEKPVLSVDFAAAIAGGSSTSSYDDIILSRWAAWLSMNIRPNGNKFNFTTLARYINNEKHEDYTTEADLVDIGSRLNYDFDPITISVEYLHRLNFTNDYFEDFRIAGIGSYKLSENLFLTATVGKNFSNIDNIIALAGINFGFSSNKVTVD